MRWDRMQLYSLMKNYYPLFFIIVTLLMSACGSAKKARLRDEKINTVIATAKSYVGTPYKWAGTSRSGMDCSGLLCTSFEAVDFSLPRTSAAQSQVGEKVNRKNLQPGDLVFFATGNKRRKVTHVGMVTEIRGDKIKFIHSSSSLGVVESNLNSKYYLKRFRMARRPF